MLAMSLGNIIYGTENVGVGDVNDMLIMVRGKVL